MADISKRTPGCDDCDEGGERGERGARGERGKRGPRGHDGERGERGATGPTGPALPFETGPTFGLGPTIPGILQPEFAPQEVTIYARTFGSDEDGDGSLGNPYATMQRAVRDVPGIIPAGVIYFVDITGITEELPAGYTLPPWKSAETFIVNFTGTFRVTMAVNIQADPEDVPLVPASDSIISVADLAGATIMNDPITDLVKIELNASRPSWANNALKGKQILGAVGGDENVVIYQSANVGGTNATIWITNDFVPTAPMRIVQPSATLTSEDPFGIVIRANNIDSITFGGLRILSSDNNGLFSDGNGNIAVQLSEMESPFISSVATEGARYVRSWTRGFPSFASPCTFLNKTFFDATFDSAFALSFSAAWASMRCSVFDGCDPIDPYFAIHIIFPAAMLQFNISKTLIRNGTGDGVIFHGGNGTLENVDIYNCAGNGVTAQDGMGQLVLNNVGTSGTQNGGVGIRVNDGMQVRVDAATSGSSTPLTGAGGDMQVGSLAQRPWSDFVANDPRKNEYDLTTPFVLNVLRNVLLPAGDETAGDGTGGRSGSRLFQRD